MITQSLKDTHFTMQIAFIKVNFQIRTLKSNRRLRSSIKFFSIIFQLCQKQSSIKLKRQLLRNKFPLDLSGLITPQSIRDKKMV